MPCLVVFPRPKCSATMSRGAVARKMSGAPININKSSILPRKGRASGIMSIGNTAYKMAAIGINLSINGTLRSDMSRRKSLGTLVIERSAMMPRITILPPRWYLKPALMYYRGATGHLGIALIQILCGKNEHELNEELSSLKMSVEPPDLRDSNITILEGEHTTLAELVAAASTVPFMSATRMIIIRGLLSKFEFRRTKPGVEFHTSLGEWKSLKISLSGLPTTTNIVFVDGSIDKKKNPLFKELHEISQIKDFPLPRSSDLPRWITKRATTLGIKLEFSAIQTLSYTIGMNLRVLDQELGKLAVYRPGKKITKKDVIETVAYVRDTSIFQAVDAIMEKNPGLALRTVHRLIADGETPSRISSMIERQIRLLFLTKELRSCRISDREIGRRVSLAAYPLSKILQQVQNFSCERLREMHRTLLHSDISIKSGQRDEKSALDLLIVDLSS